MSRWADRAIWKKTAWWQGVMAVLAGGFLFNLGQGVLRPTLPLYLQEVFAANYQMVTAIPVVFGLGKWIASLPTGYLMDRFGRRPLMAVGLLLIALCDIASVMTSAYGVFLAWRALAGVGWAMFGTVATTAMIDLPAVQRRGRAVSLLMISETFGLLLGSGMGGVLYQAAGITSPFVFEAACVLGRLLTLWLGGSASDRGGRLRVLIPGLLAYAALLGSLTFLTHPIWLGLWSLAIGAAAGFVAPLPTALLGDLAPPEQHGVAIGWLRTMTDSGQILGPLVMGALADAVHLSAPFLCAAALLLATAWWCRQHASVFSPSP